MDRDREGGAMVDLVAEAVEDEGCGNARVRVDWVRAREVEGGGMAATYCLTLGLIGLETGKEGEGIWLVVFVERGVSCGSWLLFLLPSLSAGSCTVSALLES